MFSYSFEGGSVINDEGGMPVVSQGMEFTNQAGLQKQVFKVKRYTVIKNNIIAELETTDKQIEYVELIKDPAYTLCPDCLFMKSTDLDSIKQTKLKWHILPSDVLPWKEVFRNITTLLLIAGFVYLIYTAVLFSKEFLRNLSFYK